MYLQDRVRHGAWLYLILNGQLFRHADTVIWNEFSVFSAYLLPLFLSDWNSTVDGSHAVWLNLPNGALLNTLIIFYYHLTYFLSFYFIVLLLSRFFFTLIRNDCNTIQFGEVKKEREMNLINYYERCNKKISFIFPPFGNDFYHFYEMKIKKIILIWK